MELVFKKSIEIEPEDLDAVEELSELAKQQLAIVAESFQGVTIDFEEGFRERHADDLSTVFEGGMKMVNVFDAEHPAKPLYDAWSDNVDAVYVFHHGTVDPAGVNRCQGGFDPNDEDNPNDVALAKAFDHAQAKASGGDSL